ncbi:MAG: hypothetical protein L6R37_001858 [Teloschistes peruensis]|nr:MAG: hypothetical protein L6R37_001858 [Teloschistes peruensis]
MARCLASAVFCLHPLLHIGHVMASPALSQASTAFETDASQVQDEHKTTKRHLLLRRAKEVATSQDVFLFLIAFRILNALTIRTFFQPDEYFQSLEPAWEIAFEANSGAWITWEWKNQLRSAIHPAIFAAVYRLCFELSNVLRLTPDYRAELLLAAPKATQAVIAALGDYYTWKLGERVYGKGSSEAWTVLFLTVTSAWQWFCSTRTLSNCLETTLTVIALHQWPWHWSLEATGDESADEYGLRVDCGQAEELAKLCRCFLLAAVACVLRPTNVLIWICLACFSLWKTSASGRMLKLPWVNGSFWVHVTSLVHGPATRRERVFLVLEAAICGSIVLAASAVVDRLYYQQWTFPPLRFLYFNLAQNLSIHYGRNDWHYYLSQGYPLLLTTFLPFALVGLYHSLSPPNPASTTATLLTTNIKRQLATTSLLVPFILSFISHKEVRFIYPLLPPIHILSAAPFTTYFSPLLTSHPSPTTTTNCNRKTPKRILITLLVLTNILLALFTTNLYQPAPLTVLTYLRSRASHGPPQQHQQQEITTTIAFLTPCHSTPWRSHLIHPSLKAWALTCEPPLHLPPSQHPTYRDEADRFYAAPSSWLTVNLGKPPKNAHEQVLRLKALEAVNAGVAWDGDPLSSLSTIEGMKRERKRAWTAYLVFFGQLEGEMGKVLRGSGYGVCWRGWNGPGGGWHEDWRRRGGLVVWCLDEEEKRRWRAVEGRRMGGRGDGWWWWGGGEWWRRWVLWG